MGKRVGLGILVVLSAVWGIAQLRYEVTVVNIRVPVRVFDGGRFVDSLRLEDFEVYEDGLSQPIEAVYLIRGREIRRREGTESSAGRPPETHRNYVLLFQFSEYLPEVDEAVDQFFMRVYRPGDAVDVLTPRKTLRLRGQIGSPATLKKAQAEIKSKLRNDVLSIGGAYRSVMDDMVTDLGGATEISAVSLNKYLADLERYEALSSIDPGRMAAFAADLKARPGAKHVFLLYQRDQVPQPDSRRLAGILEDPETAMEATRLVSAYQRGPDVDREQIERVFSDASTDVHFLYVTRNRFDPRLNVERSGSPQGIQMKESSSAIFQAFREVAAATGGTSAASANPAALLLKAAEASEQYYLLYYRPPTSLADGRFHKIEVKIKRSSLKVSHRAGYFTVDASAPAAGPAAEPAVGANAPAEEIESIDLTGGVPAKGASVPAAVLNAASSYCRRLEEASLDFVCREEVRERISGAWSGRPPRDVGPTRDLRIVEDIAREWTYDYQLVRKEGWAVETRTLIEEDRKPKRVENAALQTSRFFHKFVVLGPAGLFSEDAQRRHDYVIAQENEVDREPILIIDVRPKAPDASSLHGKAWLRLRDGAILKVEWEPASMGNYADIESFAKAHKARPRIRFASEYAFEKNGLRFPSSYEVSESYLISGRTARLSLTTVAYRDYKFFEVKVRSEVKRLTLFD